MLLFSNHIISYSPLSYPNTWIGEDAGSGWAGNHIQCPQPMPHQDSRNLKSIKLHLILLSIAICVLSSPTPDTNMWQEWQQILIVIWFDISISVMHKTRHPAFMLTPLPLFPSQNFPIIMNFSVSFCFSCVWMECNTSVAYKKPANIISMA